MLLLVITKILYYISFYLYHVEIMHL